MAQQPSPSPLIYAPGNQGIITNNQTGNNYINPGPIITASVQHQEATGDPDAPWRTVFFITTTAPAQTGDLRLKCSGPCLKAGIGRINKFELVTGSNGPIPGDPTTVLYELKPQTLSPGVDLPVAVYSMQPVTVINGEIGPHGIRF